MDQIIFPLLNDKSREQMNYDDSDISTLFMIPYLRFSQDFLGDFGGNLGLCLGWSLLDAYGLFTPIFKSLTHMISGGTKKF